MKSTFLIALLFAAALSPSIAGAASTNSVDLYTQAFDRLEKDTGDLKPLDNVNATPMNDATGKFLSDRAEIIGMLRDAAKMPPAVWPSAQEVKGVLPSLQSARRASNLLVLQSRWDLNQKQSAQAADDVLAAIALGRNVAMRKTFISTLVDIGIETLAIDKLAAMLPALPKDVQAALSAKIAALPKPLSGKELMDGEFEFGKVASANENIPAAIFEAAGPFYKAVGDAMPQSQAQFEQTIDAEAMKLMLNPFVQNQAPTLKRIHESIIAMDAKRAMLDTAVAIVNSGPDAVKQSKDPAGDGPFEYAQNGGGFRLTSKAVTRDKPVTLIVGR